jgi:hypothetical protein
MQGGIREAAPILRNNGTPATCILAIDVLLANIHSALFCGSKKVGTSWNLQAENLFPPRGHPFHR